MPKQLMSTLWRPPHTYHYTVDNVALANPHTNILSWNEQLQRPLHPVVCISWEMAVMYTEWLTRMTGISWQLPTEAEWEKAACWDEAQQVSRIWPWGDLFEVNFTNTYESGRQASLPMGSMVNDISPYGVRDMAGNVLDWCRSLYQPYPYNPLAAEEMTNRDADRVLRGGSWAEDRRQARTKCRSAVWPEGWLDDWGFRIACNER